MVSSLQAFTGRLIQILFFFFNDTATTEIYTLSLHDALPISRGTIDCSSGLSRLPKGSPYSMPRSEEHTSELQSQSNLVCRLLLEKKKEQATHPPFTLAILRWWSIRSPQTPGMQARQRTSTAR